jgi:ABC-type sugar transport system ATPase subunit
MAFVEMRNITKTFPGVVALDNVDFDCEEGAVHGLIGENGAGKSTLIKTLNGEYQPDAGGIFVDGDAVNMINPAKAMKTGISVIHQEFNLINQLSIAKNIFLGREPAELLGRVDSAKLYKDSKELLGRVGLGDLDPRTEVSKLNIERKQLVEVAKALSVDARLIVMDEPTAALNGEEVGRLFTLIRGLIREGRGVIFVSHRMEEVFAISDIITVLRDGKVIDTQKTEELTPEIAVRMMTGKEQINRQLTRRLTEEQPLLEVRGFGASGQFKNLDLTLHAGEILGLVGLEGQGQREVLRALFGDLPEVSGEIVLQGKPLKLRSPKDAIHRGFAFLPEERKEEGLCLALNIKDNIALPTLDRRKKMGFVQKNLERHAAEKAVNDLRIVPPMPNRIVGFLSGGNQQKTVLGKWLTARPRVLLFSEPTRGIDVGAKEEIYNLMLKIAEEGNGIIMVSGDLTEVLRICHRIAVMYEGEIIKIFNGESASKEEVLRAMWGLDKQKQNNYSRVS